TNAARSVRAALPRTAAASNIRAFQRRRDMNRTNLGTACRIAVLAVVAMLPAAVAAAEEPTIDQQVQMIRSLTEAQRQATMAANVVLTEDEATKFWPLYRDYRNDVSKINDKLVALIKDYSENYEAMTDQKAKSYTTGYL